MTETTETKGRNSKPGYMIMNVVLLAGLIILYILHFSAKHQLQEKPDYHAPISNVGVAPKIAFIDSDILMETYDIVPEMVKTFEASTREKESVIREKQKELEQKISEFQQRLQSGNISMEIAQITEQQLMREQQELMKLRDELSEQLAMEEYTMNMQLLEIVSEFLEEYNRTKQYDLIFNFKQGTNIFIASKAYDITTEVVELLNQEYRLRRPRR